MKLNTLAFLTCIAFSAVAQPAPAADDGPKKVTRLIHMDYGTNDVTRLLNGISGVEIRQSGSNFVLTGPAADVDAVQALMKTLNVPPPVTNIELTAYLVIASKQGAQGATLPKELEPAISQVSAVFPYKSYSLLDSVIVRMASDPEGQSGQKGGSASGVLPAGPSMPQGNYRLNVVHAGLISSKSGAQAVETITVSRLQLHLEVRTGTDPKTGNGIYTPVEVATSVDLKPGQKAVIGKANIDDSDRALIVVLTGKVAD